MLRRTTLSLLVWAGVVAATPASPPEAYRIKPSEIQLPAGVALGQYRRIVQPFQNWVMICDENLMRLQKVCNVSQTIINSRGDTVFSWTMAAVSNGVPVMILRAPAMVGKGKDINLEFVGMGVGQVKLDACDPKICMAIMQLTNGLKKAVNEGRDVKITYTDNSGRTVSFTAPLRGLADAVNSLG